MASSSCVCLVGIHPYYQHHTFRKPKPILLTSSKYVHANLTSSLLRTSCSYPNSLLITGQKHKIQFLSPITLQHPNVFPSKRSTICTATLFGENTPKVPATEICTLVLVYIIPFLNRLNLLSKFPVLKCVMPLVGFYQSIPTLGCIVFLALFIVLVRYKNFNEYSLQAMVMDVVVVIASLVRPFLVNPVPGGAVLGFKFQLLHVLELLGFQICVHSCLKYLDAVQWVGEEEDTLSHLMKVVIKNEENEGRLVGKSLVLKFLRGQDNLLGDMSSTETCNNTILSSCQSCLNSLLHLFKQGTKNKHRVDMDEVEEQISLEVDNLLWLLDILEDRQAAEEFALMWANQQKLASLHKKVCRLSTRHLVSCITTRLFAGIRNGKILAEKDTRQLLLQTWFQPLVDDYPRLKDLKSFDPKKLEENIEVGILEPIAEAPLMPKGTYVCLDIQKGFERWCRRVVKMLPFF
ncbi:hypothetical protein MKW98_005812 [Papaver atlanticum]|uniref:At3g05675-like ankyrin-like domain-containing protein n=1 Tax=Papaver atlanticum TaxID=357466 RepID=A0AAD4XZH9_9MAGN|nr:hypothetical protein MKW98_005812 [Papaver atlanticum]